MSRVVAIIQRNVLAWLALTFVVGAIFGLTVLGWYVWPLKWSTAITSELGPAGQHVYLAMLADSYELTKNESLARQRLQDLYPSKSPAQIAAELDIAATAPGRDPDTADRIRQLVVVLGPAASPETGVLPTPPRPSPTLMRRFLQTCGLVILALVVLAGALLLVYFLQTRTTGSPAQREAPLPAVAAVETRPAAVGPPATAPPSAEPVVRTPPTPATATLGSFVATYNLGDIDFDMSFGIEAQNGDFLGECGLGMAETIGGGDVQRVSAFEVWLFDKTDIRTVSVVLASAHAHADPALRTKLASRGDIVLAEPGQVFSVKTSSLKLQGRVLDMAYGGGDVPAQGYFTTFSVELVPVPITDADESQA